MDVGYGFFEV